jgi:hypothetical protein
MQATHSSLQPAVVGIDVAEVQIQCVGIRFAGPRQDVGSAPRLPRDGNDRRVVIEAELVGQCDNAVQHRRKRHTARLRNTVPVAISLRSLGSARRTDRACPITPLLRDVRGMPGCLLLNDARMNVSSPSTLPPQ